MQTVDLGERFVQMLRTEGVSFRLEKSPDRRRTGQNRGSWVLAIQPVQVGVVWQAVRTSLLTPIVDADDDLSFVNVGVDLNNLWVFRYWYRNPTKKFGASWAEMFECRLALRGPLGASDKAVDGIDDALPHVAVEYVEGREGWPTLCAAQISDGRVEIGAR